MKIASSLIPSENFIEGLFQVCGKVGRPCNYQGKVRDIFLGETGQTLIIVTTDRQYAFVDLVCTVSGKGEILNRTSEYWFTKTKHIVPNHLVNVSHPNVMLCKYVKDIFPIEVIVRNYIAQSKTPTSIYYQYFEKKRRNIYGIEFPDNLNINDQLPNGPIVTPTTKARDGHDQELNEEEARTIVKEVSGSDMWLEIKSISLELFQFASDLCIEKGLILADTKFEFGLTDKNELILVDELLTPECSRLWSLEDYALNKDVVTSHKDSIVDWLSNQGYVGQGEIPVIPLEIKQKQLGNYMKSFERITGIKSLDNLNKAEYIKNIL